VEYGEELVLNGLTQVLYNSAFIAQAKQAVSPFGSGCAAQKIGQFIVEYFSKTSS
jgi:UDP-N-acetylglucosamine 2-epimerase